MGPFALVKHAQPRLSDSPVLKNIAAEGSFM